jgi:hypothetical protein
MAQAESSAIAKIYFTDFFDIPPTLLEEYGAFNISLVNDLPLFIDPFLLFNSQNPCAGSYIRGVPGWRRGRCAGSGTDRDR